MDKTALLSESRCERTMNIDALSTVDMLRAINEEDKLVPLAVEAVTGDIARSLDMIFERVSRGGRLIYVGAGTSGRLGVLDASECPPTFGTPSELVSGYIAGGFDALIHAAEGAEDDAEAGAALIDSIGVGALDCVVCISASGGAPYVAAAGRRAKSLGAAVIGLVTNENTVLHGIADVCIAPLVGAEVITGSTRMKSGTAQKLVLNMLSTGLMIKLGKVYGNLMVDMRATNDKLRKRAVRIVAAAADVSERDAQALLDSAHGSVKTAIVMQKCSVSEAAANAMLKSAGGVLRRAIEAYHEEKR